MSKYENDVANKIKQQLKEEEIRKEEATFYGFNEKVEESTEVENAVEEIVEDTVNLEMNEDSTEEVVSDHKSKKENSFVAKIMGIERAETEHFKRKEKIRPLALIYSIISFIVCAGILALGVVATIAIAKPFWGIIVSLVGVFFNEKVLVFSLGLGCILGGLIIIFVAGFGLCLIGFFVMLSFLTISIPIVGFSNMKLPKQVFAYERDSRGNMTFSYILGVLVTILGFFMFMDGSYEIASIVTLIVGVVFFVIAILLTIDIVKAKKYFKNYDNEQEKQEIIKEANVIKSNKETKRKNRKLIGRWLSKLSKKK